MPGFAQRSLRRPPRALLALAAVCVGLAAQPREAAALTCESGVMETLELELERVTEDGAELEPSSVFAHPELAGLAELRTLTSIETGGVRVSTEDFSAVWLELDAELQPTPSVQSYLDESAQRTSGGLLCSGIPYLPLRPGVFVLEDSHADVAWPADATLTLDAARETATLEFGDADHDYAITYAIADYYFPSEQGGCSISDTPQSPAPPFGLALLLAILSAPRPRNVLGLKPCARSPLASRYARHEDGHST